MDEDDVTAGGADLEPEISRRDLIQERVRVRLARGDTYEQAARAGGVHARTVARWMTQPEFSLSVSDARREQVNAVTGLLSEAASEAVQVLLAAMRSDDVAVSSRAAQAVLTWQTKFRRAGDIEDRLLKVEARDGLRPAAEAEAS